MAMSEIYVDPSINADSGTGTIGDPFGDLEYAIKQTTFDTTNGTRVNVKSGSTEYLQADLGTAQLDTVTTVAWVESVTAQAVIQGYTAAAGDGGRATIDCTTSGSLIGTPTARRYQNLIDLDIVNTSALVINTYAETTVMNCSIEGNASAKCVSMTGVYNVFHNNYVYGHTSGSYCVDLSSVIVTNNYISQSGTGPTLWVLDGDAYIANNILVIGHADGDGIYTSGNSCIVNNSIYNSTGVGTGQAIYLYTTGLINNNLIEGFNGTGGRAIDVQTTTKPVLSIQGNGFYNNESNFNGTAITLYESDNETLGVSPFTDAANGDFSPVDTGNVKEGSSPGVIGAGQV